MQPVGPRRATLFRRRRRMPHGVPLPFWRDARACYIALAEETDSIVDIMAQSQGEPFPTLASGRSSCHPDELDAGDVSPPLARLSLPHLFGRSQMRTPRIRRLLARCRQPSPEDRAPRQPAMSLIGARSLLTATRSHGDNIFLGDRNGVRTLRYLWSPDSQRGLLRPPAGLYRRRIMDPIYGYRPSQRRAQSRSPASLLNGPSGHRGAQGHRALARGTLRSSAGQSQILVPTCVEHSLWPPSCVVATCRARASPSSSTFRVKVAFRRIAWETAFPPIASCLTSSRCRRGALLFRPHEDAAYPKCHAWRPGPLYFPRPGHPRMN